MRVEERNVEKKVPETTRRYKRKMLKRKEELGY